MFSTDASIKLMALIVISLLTALFPVLARAGNSHSPCNRIQFVGKEEIGLTAMEIRLVCGDPDTEGWEKVPFNQAETFLRAFLQQRGYHEPKFSQGRDVLSVDPGAMTSVSSFSVTGLPPEIDPRRLRKIKGQLLTPKMLDKANTTLLNTLQNRGYACPVIKIKGNGATGEIAAEVHPGDLYRFGRIPYKKTTNVAPEVFYRYEAFETGQLFDSRLLELTAQRSMTDSLFLSAYFVVSCSTGGMTITERVVSGKPQLYKLGVGFDTEGLLIVKASWLDSRIGNWGHSMGASLYASFREQSASANFRYFTGPASRFYLMPKLTFGRQDETQYESFQSELALLPTVSRDTKSIRAEFSAGPALKYAHTVRGLGPVRYSYGAFQTQVDLLDHLFEYYAAEPQTGWHITFKSQSQVAGMYSSITAHRLDLQGQHIWNLGGYDPPLLVLATRYRGQTTLVNNGLLASGDIPLDLRYFMGGDANLRGAGHNDLPSDDIGLLTTVYDGIEVRLGDVLFHGVQPLVFLDTAMGGRDSFHLDPNVYFSPGFGFRWSSPVGSIRATLARGMVWRRDPSAETLLSPQWRFFLSLGTEF